MRRTVNEPIQIHTQVSKTFSLTAFSAADVKLLERLAAILATDTSVNLTTLIELWERHTKPKGRAA